MADANPAGRGRSRKVPTKAELEVEAEIANADPEAPVDEELEAARAANPGAIVRRQGIFIKVDRDLEPLGDTPDKNSYIKDSDGE